MPASPQALRIASEKLRVSPDRAAARWRSRLRFARGARSLGRLARPRQLAFYFELQRQAEKGADQNDESKHEHVLQRGRDDDGADDVARDEELQPEQNRAAKVLPVKAVAIAGGLRPLEEKPARRDEGTEHHDEHASAINGDADDFDDVAEMIHSYAVHQ